MSPTDAEGSVVTGDPNDIPLRDRELITVAFVPEGTDVPKPPSTAAVTRPADVPRG